jgi:transketolase
VVLDADLMKATGTMAFKNRFPERTFDIGVAEANMVGVAAGLSAGGKIPFAASFGCFASRRAFDQFFLSCNYARQNVKLVGTDPGVSAGFNGGTHMPFEDAGLMRLIPGVVIFEPSDPVSCKALTAASYEHKGCTYMRLHRKPIEPLYPENEKFELGQGKVLRDGNDVAIFAWGAIMVPTALKAAGLLEKEGVSAAVIDILTLKPIDRELVVSYAKKTGAVVTCENHQINNGLGSAVAEILCEEVPTRLLRIGIRDQFGEVGTQDELIQRFRLTPEDIVADIKQFLS